MDKVLMQRAFNEWMRRYTEEPEKFEAEFRTVNRFLEESKGGEPTYGERATALLESIANDLGG